MKKLQWVRFTWDLSTLSESPIEMPKRFRIRLADKEDREETLRLIRRAFAMDSDWLDGSAEAFGFVEPLMAKSIDPRSVACLLLCDGPRAVGASLLHVIPESENHLVTGPCISSEYRNRKLGSLLFDLSLRHLRKEGLQTVHGVVKQKCLAARYLYPRYEPMVEVYAFPQEAA